MVIPDFIEVYEGMFSKEYCEDVMSFFDEELNKNSFDNYDKEFEGNLWLREAL